MAEGGCDKMDSGSIKIQHIPGIWLPVRVLSLRYEHCFTPTCRYVGTWGYSQGVYSIRSSAGLSLLSYVNSALL